MLAVNIVHNSWNVLDGYASTSFFQGVNQPSPKERQNEVAHVGEKNGEKEAQKHLQHQNNQTRLESLVEKQSQPQRNQSHALENKTQPGIQVKEIQPETSEKNQTDKGSLPENYAQDRSGKQSSQINQIAAAPIPVKQPTWKFVPFPHLSLPVGNDAICKWTHESNDQNSTLSRDKIQQAAHFEGMCLPQKPNRDIHVFSSADAIECLSQAERVVLTGDSYTRQLYIGLRDILMNDPNTTQLRDSTRRFNAITRSQADLQKLGDGKNTTESHPLVELICYYECYGVPVPDHGITLPFEEVCLDCLQKNPFANNTINNTALFVGSGAHVLNVHNWNATETISVMAEFMKGMPRMIYISLPERKDIKNGMTIYKGLQNAAKDSGATFLDVYHLTESCKVSYGNCKDDSCRPRICSVDGGNHRSRFVNRWKAQLALNMICQKTLDS